MQRETDTKDTERTRSISLPSVRSNPFGSNISGEKAYRRAERITAALYILTRHVSDREPLRSHARNISHALLQDVMGLKSGFRTEGEPENITGIHARVRETISIAQLLSVAGYCSKENTDMLTRALEELSQFIEVASTTALSERIIFTKEDLLIDQTIRTGTARSQVTTTKGQDAPSTHGTVRKDTQTLKGQNKVADNFSSRKSAILEVLKDGKKMGIKDIASFVIGCSEKTIQRELATLVLDKLIHREGEKRWSRYFIAR